MKHRDPTKSRAGKKAARRSPWAGFKLPGSRDNKGERTPPVIGEVK